MYLTRYHSILETGINSCHACILIKHLKPWNIFIYYYGTSPIMRVGTDNNKEYISESYCDKVYCRIISNKTQRTARHQKHFVQL